MAEKKDLEDAGPAGSGELFSIFSMNSTKKNNTRHNKILVALSGGVDSAVAAALLKKQGYEVIGAYFRFFESTWKPNFQVKKIAKKLGIPLKIVDARKEFKKRVIDYFLDAYEAGLTPNPCVVCNKEMKFRLHFDLMKKYEADYVATGHYARITKQSSAFSFRKLNFRNSSKPSFFYKLLEATDKTKDQSYFLYRLSQKDLAKIIFPLGEYQKSDVKRLAKKMKLPTLESESQDICFVARNDLYTYLNKYLKSSRGNVIDASGNAVGLHRGLPFYTIGQRKGIEIGGTGPYWVAGKNIRKNELIVTDNPKNLFTKKFLVGKVNWINKGIKLPLQAKVQIRYQSKRISARIALGKSGKLIVETKKPLRAVTAGQSAVFYKGKEVLGGGTII